MNIINEAAKNIANRLAWHTAECDQAGIAQELTDGEDIPEVYGLGEAALFDEFFYFFDHFGFKDHFVGLDLKTKKRKSPVAFTVIIYMYLMRVVAGLKFYWHIDPVILHFILSRLCGLSVLMVGKSGKVLVIEARNQRNLAVKYVGQFAHHLLHRLFLQ